MFSLTPPYKINLELQSCGIWSIFPKSNNYHFFPSSILYCCKNPNRLVQDNLKRSIKSLFKLTDLNEDEFIISFNKTRFILTNYRLVIDEYNHFFSIPLENIVFWKGFIRQEDLISDITSEINDSFLYFLNKNNEFDFINKEVEIPFLSQELMDSLMKKSNLNNVEFIGLLNRDSLLDPDSRYEGFIKKLVETSENQYSQNIDSLKSHINNSFQSRVLTGAVVTEII